MLFLLESFNVEELHVFLEEIYQFLEIQNLHLFAISSVLAENCQNKNAVLVKRCVQVTWQYISPKYHVTTLKCWNNINIFGSFFYSNENLVRA